MACRNDNLTNHRFRSLRSSKRTSGGRMGFSLGRMCVTTVEVQTGGLLEGIQIKKIEQVVDDRIDQKINGDCLGHVATSKHQALILETGINEQVIELYNLGASAFSPSTALMKHSLPDLLQLPLAYKIHWIISAKIAKAKKDKQQAGPYASKHRQMQKWLIRTQNNLR